MMWWGGDLKNSTAGIQKNGDKNTLSKKDMRTEKNIVESYFNFKLNGKNVFHFQILNIEGNIKYINSFKATLWCHLSNNSQIIKQL